ncbi:MAG: HPr family phosphocarrier protein [Chloroflexota bacterium]
MAELRLRVLDPSGLHGRPAAQVVRTSARFAARISIQTGDRNADAKSLIGLLGLTIRPGSDISIVADGPDAGDALAALRAELGATVEPATGSESSAEPASGSGTTA